MKALIKHIITSALAAMAFIPAGSQSRLENGTVSSRILGTDKPYIVYLPDGYDRNPDRQYPILYLLHGLSGNCETWAKKYDMKTITDFRIASGFSLPMIVVMPDARGVLPNNRGDNVGYANRGSWRYEDFFFQEFIPTIESRYRVQGDRAHRAVSGLSMGGFGTVLYAMHHPDLFSSACPMSARVEGTPGREPGTGGDSEAFYEMCRQNNMVEYLRAQSPEAQKAIGSVRWYIDCADGDSLLPGNMHLYELMCGLDFPMANFRVREGAHKTDYWRTSLPEVLTFISIAFEQ